MVYHCMMCSTLELEAFLATRKLQCTGTDSVPVLILDSSRRSTKNTPLLHYCIHILMLIRQHKYITDTGVACTVSCKLPG